MVLRLLSAFHQRTLRALLCRDCLHLACIGSQVVEASASKYYAAFLAALRILAYVFKSRGSFLCTSLC
eukprot:5644081-Amphidinium_carterae.2